jgi:large subunit ribosomal protein L30
MYSVIRIRGTVGTRKDVEDTLKDLRLNRPNNCIVIPEKNEYLGMLRKVKDHITWGKIDKKTLTKLLEKRGKILSNKPIDKQTLKDIGFENFDKLSDALITGKVNLKDFKSIKPVFKLNPPLHGYKSTKLPFPKGDLGNRKEKINELLERMV